MFSGAVGKTSIFHCYSRAKGGIGQREIRLLETVIIIDESTPRNVWAIGPITEEFPDKYGLFRCVKVKIKTSTLEHPISKLCLLESIEQLEAKVPALACVTSGIA